MKYISLFKNFTKEVGNRTLTQIVNGIRGDHYRQSILKIRALIQSGHKGKANQLKKELVAFTVSGLFEGGRKIRFLKTYNPFVILDIDKLNPSKLPGLILKIKQIEFTKVCFISPSGRGLKIIVEVDSKMKNHKATYWQVMNFYKDYLMVEIDKSGSDITRLCFMSYDPDVYFNEKSTVFKVSASETDTTKTSRSAPDLMPRRAPDLSGKSLNLRVDYSDAFKTCVGRTDAELAFKSGNRNNYIYRLGVFCFYAGIPVEIAIEESNKTFDFDNYEMERTIKNAYSWEPSPAEEKLARSSSDTPSLNPANLFYMSPEIIKKDFFHTVPFKDLANSIPALVDFLKKHPTEFKLKETHRKKLKESFRKMMKNARQNYGNHMANNLKGMELNCFKIAMILSTLRKFDEKNTTSKLVCTDQDFEVALTLSKKYWEHSILYYLELPNQSDPRESNRT